MSTSADSAAGPPSSPAESDACTGMPTLADLRAAARRIAPFAHRTPVFTCAGIDALLGGSLHFKCENLQKVGAFKFRGACNTVFSLSDEQAARGVATHSSGNHGAAVALAARLRGVESFVVMPSNASAVKRAAVTAYGAHVIDCEPTERGRRAAVEAVIAEHGCTLVHPFDDARVIAGQGTAALELASQVPGLDVVLTPVGGGGLLSGTALAYAAISPAARVVGAEPAGADDAYRSFRAGRIVPVESPSTIADGLRTSLGELNFAIIRAHVHDIVRVNEEAIVEAMRMVWQRMKLVIEPSAAVPLAAMLEGAFDARGARVGVMLSGGNVDLDALPWCRR